MVPLKSSGTLKPFLHAFPSCLLSFWLIACAGQAPPGGGPLDRTAPVVVRTDPDTNAVRVETDRVILEFSEHVDRRSVEQSVFISPWPGEVEYEWSGTEVAIKFPQPLRKNRTYVVSLGTDVIDRRERNRMAAGFSLAFSTGDSIDQGFIIGRVYDHKAEGVMVFAYLLDGLNPDTLNPGTLRPDYVTQTGKGGAFTLANIAFGTYRVIAVRDEYHDLLYGKQVDQFGVWNGDVVLNRKSPRALDLRFQLSTEDTSGPFLTTVRAVDRHTVAARYNEAIDSLSVVGAVITLTDTVGGSTAATLPPYILRGAPSTMIVPVVDDLDSGVVYRFRAAGLTDRAGNAVDPTHLQGEFVAEAIPDTVPPTARIFGMKDSLRGRPLDEPLLVVFSEPVERTSAERGISVVDSGGRGVEVDRRWLGPADMTLAFPGPLRSHAWYGVIMRLDSLRDLRGNAGPDSTRVVRFETMDIKTAGVIEGSVKDERMSTGEIVLTARNVGAADSTWRILRLPGPGSFVLKDLPEGLYALQAFRDADSTGAYSFGMPFPFVPSERFTVFPDTVKVRARWGVESVTLQLK